MQVLGLDIGTTTVSTVVMENGKVLAAKTLKNDSFLPGRPAWEKVQDPAVIRATAMGAVEELLEEYPLVEKIGVTGQMHGILYLDSRGEAVSPLYIWQDGRGDLPYDESCSPCLQFLAVVHNNRILIILNRCTILKLWNDGQQSHG